MASKLFCNNTYYPLGIKVKGFWFKIHGQQILAEMEPESTFAFCNGWFDRFKARHKISLRRSTNVAQKPANDKRSAVQSFHREIQKFSTLSKWKHYTS